MNEKEKQQQQKNNNIKNWTAVCVCTRASDMHDI